MIWLRLLGTLVRVLREGATPNQIAGGFVLGFAIGALPGWPVQVWLLLALLLLLNVNLAMAGAGAAVAVALAWAFDPWLDTLGGWVLGLEALRGIFTVAYNQPAWMLTRFNNTVMMGNLAALLLALPLTFLLVRRGVVAWRVRLLPSLERLRVVQLYKGSRVYAWWQRIERLRFWS